MSNNLTNNTAMSSGTVKAPKTETPKTVASKGKGKSKPNNKAKLSPSQSNDVASLPMNDKAIEAIAGLKATALTVIDGAIKATEQADVSSQSVCALAMRHFEAIKASGNNSLTWNGMVNYKGDRMLTDMGKAWIKQVKLDYLGVPVLIGDKKKATEKLMNDAKRYIARAKMTEEGCKLAIAAGSLDGKSSDYDPKTKVMSVDSSVFLPCEDPRGKAEHAAVFVFGIKGKVPLDGGNYMYDKYQPKTKTIARMGGKFSMRQALATYYAKPAHLRTATSTSSTTPGDKGADEAKTDQTDAATRRKVFKSADLFRDLFPAFQQHIEDAKNEPWKLEDFDDQPVAWSVIQFFALAYGRLSTEAQARVNAPKTEAKTSAA